MHRITFIKLLFFSFRIILCLRTIPDFVALTYHRFDFLSLSQDVGVANSRPAGNLLLL